MSPDGVQYKLSDVLREVASMVDMFVSTAHLTPAFQLPAGTDLSEFEEINVQAQILEILNLHPAVISVFWDTFAANHLTDIAASLRRLSDATQPRAVSTVIQILALIPEPKEQLYFRRFLRNRHASKGLPEIIVNAFIKGTAWKRPSSMMQHCTLISQILVWCDPRLGDDGKAPIDAELRGTLASNLQAWLERTWLERPEVAERDEPGSEFFEMNRLRGILRCIEGMPVSYYLDSSREFLEELRSADECHGNSCDEEAELSCSKCKMVRYCGKECQAWHWKNGHRAHCFKTEY
ncbi:hypothetical protein DFH06DRAFT_1185125 [Mycena polygramma]|nr:hypothetical protein DFH06DRAFT_1185125 [Mycena polygramma]